MARSAYVHQVRRIFPGELIGREAELSELAEFCTSRDGCQWLWWQAPAWSGKSALMAWFALHPPSAVQIVSFFITTRFSGQSNRAAFVDVVLEQLAEVTGNPVPASLTDATQEAHLLDLLEEAAMACQARDQQLVLVVDGLDEDRGVTTGPESHSIAALLPARLPAGVSVVVTGRPNPPLPPDVADSHPLRDPRIIRRLSPSPEAQIIKNEALRELKHLLQGTSPEQDLLGLVTAAGGGLSSADLAEMTSCPVPDIEDYLTTVSGRTFSSRTSHFTAESGTPLYVLAHDELQSMAVERLGYARLREFRERLCIWADGYRDREWPAETPEYLVRGYFQLLESLHDIPRMVACCLDESRHERMLQVTGGDHTALMELTATLGGICAASSPDLLVMLRLAIERDRLLQRHSSMPPDLPSAWVTLGNRNRAETLARSIGDPFRQAQSLVVLILALQESGYMDGITELIGVAEDLEAYAKLSLKK